MDTYLDRILVVHAVEYGRKEHQPVEFVGQSSTGATHAFLVQFPYMQSSGAVHLEPISPLITLCPDDKDDGKLMHFVLESPMIPNTGEDSARGCEGKKRRVGRGRGRGRGWKERSSCTCVALYVCEFNQEV